VLQNGVATRARHISGWLTIADVAARLQVSRTWVKRRIHNGTITIQRDPRDKRYLFPDTPAGIAGLKELKSGERKHLVVDPRPTK
jgi:excisionase family DNA binding protein